MQIEYESSELYHWGIKGMKWRPNRPNAKKKKVVSGSGNTHRRGTGFGTGKVGSTNRPGTFGPRPQSHKKKVVAGSGNTHRRGSGTGAGKVGTTARPAKKPFARRPVDKKYAVKNRRYTRQFLGR